MDNFEFDVELNYKKRWRPIPMLLLVVVSIGLAYGAAYLLRMLVPSIFVEGSVIYTEFFGLVWGLPSSSSSWSTYLALSMVSSS